MSQKIDGLHFIYRSREKLISNTSIIVRMEKVKQKKEKQQVIRRLTNVLFCWGLYNYKWFTLNVHFNRIYNEHSDTRRANMYKSLIISQFNIITGMVKVFSTHSSSKTNSRYNIVMGQTTHLK